VTPHSGKATAPRIAGQPSIGNRVIGDALPRVAAEVRSRVTPRVALGYRLARGVRHAAKPVPNLARLSHS
jgi:hypothetical protein